MPKKKTHEKYIQELKNINPNVEVTSQYTGANERIKVKCLICNNTWMPIASSLLVGKGCPYCSGRISWDANSFKQEVERKNPNTEVVGDYVRNKDLVQCRCKRCGHKWEARPDHLIKGHGCPRCAEHLRTSFQEQAIYYYAQKHFHEVTNRWSSSGFELDVYIESKKVGIEYDGNAWHKDKLDRDNKKDELCKRSNIKLIRIRDVGLVSTSSAVNIMMHNQSDKELSRCIEAAFREIALVNYDIDVERDRNDIFTQYTQNTRGNSLADEHPELVVEWDYQKNGDITPEHFSSMSHNKVWWKCSNCGYSWFGRIDHRASGHGCAKCAGVAKKTSEDFEEELEKINPDIVLLEKYEKRNKKIRCKCKQCGNIWFPYPGNLLKGSGCPVCSRKKAVEKRRKTTK